jgi:hypothetical protein
MANNNFPHGLTPLLICLSGGVPVLRNFSKAAGYGTAIFRHDVVNRVADGSIEAGGTPGTTTYTGVALNYGAASTATTHGVYITPDALYEAQDDGDSSTLDAADMGLNCNLVFTAGNSATKHSKHQIDGSSKNTTATLDVKLLELYAVPNNEHGQYARVVVMFNKHRLLPNVAGV